MVEKTDEHVKGTMQGRMPAVKKPEDISSGEISDNYDPILDCSPKPRSNMKDDGSFPFDGDSEFSFDDSSDEYPYDA